MRAHRMTMSVNPSAVPTTEIDYVAVGTTGIDDFVMTRVYYFIYDSRTGVLRAAGAKSTDGCKIEPLMTA